MSQAFESLRVRLHTDDLPGAINEGAGITADIRADIQQHATFAKEMLVASERRLVEIESADLLDPPTEMRVPINDCPALRRKSHPR